MQVTVIICTRDRAEQLRRTLESAAAIETPEGVPWEVLVVDNGSSDHTPQVVKSFAGSLPIRCVDEPEAGLSNARNRGVAEAKGKYICWTDDDVIIDRRWLSAYVEAFARHPEAAFFGGPIEIVFDGSIPSWLERNRKLIGPIFAERAFGDSPMRLNPAADIIPFGANYAVRAQEQRQHKYDPNLGVSPTQRRLGEETALLEAIAETGREGWWVPDARIRHIIPAQRRTIAYMAEYRRAAGETNAYLADLRGLNLMQRLVRVPAWPFQGAPLHVWFVRGGHLVLHHFCSLFGASAASLRHYLRYAYYDGVVSYWRNCPANRKLH